MDTHPGAIYLSKKFPQTDLLLPRDFAEYCQARGLKINVAGLERLEAEKLMLPLLRVTRRPVEGAPSRLKYGMIPSDIFNLRAMKEDGMVEFPEGIHFQPWAEYKDGHEERVLSYYHPLQVVLAHQVHEANLVIFNADILSAKEPEVLARVTRVREWHSKSHEWNLSRQKHFSKLLPLLLDIEDIFVPRLRGKYTFTSLRDIDHEQEEWFEWQRSIDWKEILTKHDWTLEEAKDSYNRWAFDAFNLDPLREWFLLVRYVDPEHRAKLKREALLAQDYYDVAYMLKWTVEQAGGGSLPDPDDVMNPQQGRDWKTRWYGSPDVLGNRRVLLQLLTEYGLNPSYVVHLIVEGETEEVFTKAWAVGVNINLEELGVHIDVIGGVGGIKPSHLRSLLLHAQEDRGAPYLILDNDEDVRKHLEDLKRLSGPRGWPLLSEGFYHVWNGEFEDDNFTSIEIVDAFNRLAATLGITSTMTGPDLDDAKVKQGGRNVSKALKRIAWDRCQLDIAGHRRKLAELLAESTERRIKEATAQGKRYEPTKPMETQLMKVVEIASDLRSGALFEWELPRVRGSP